MEVVTMYLTPRQKLILREVLASQKGASIDKLVNLLKVSKRTVYREIAVLTETLSEAGITFLKGSKHHYVIEANEAQLKLLKESAETQSENDLEFSQTERQHIIVLQYFLYKKRMTVEQLSDEFFVSNHTILTDLAQIEQKYREMPDFFMKKSPYITINTNENALREIVTEILDFEINAYSFFYLQELQGGKTGYFLQYFIAKDLVMLKQIFKHFEKLGINQLSDDNKKYLMILIAVSILRVREGHSLQIEHHYEINKESLNLAQQIYIEVGKQTHQLFNLFEITHLALKLSRLVETGAPSIFNSQFDSQRFYQIREFVTAVSNELNGNFELDTQLFSNLSAAFSQMATRLNINEQDFSNPILTQIAQVNEENQGLIQVIKEKLALFFRREAFTEDNVALIALYFLISTDVHPNPLGMKIGLISEYDETTSTLVVNRLKRFFPFVKKVELLAVSTVNEQNLTDFDYLLSTSLLSGFEHDYKLVSLALNNEEIRELTTLFNRKQQQMKQFQIEKEEPKGLTSLFERVELSAYVLQNFKIEVIDNPTSFEETLKYIARRLSRDVISDDSAVADGLIKRYHQAPIGIPNTRFALAHSASQLVINPYFAIFDLKKAIKVQGMDQEDLVIDRLLLLLAPEINQETNLSILGKISSSIIENSLNTEIYNSGNEEIIFQLLNKVLA